MVDSHNCTAEARQNITPCYNLLCYNGDCGKTFLDDEPDPIWECTCDKGWIGSQCQTCCDLPCEHGGRCMFEKKKYQQVMACNCYETGYLGTYCDQEIITNSSSSAKSGGRNTVVIAVVTSLTAVIILVLSLVICILIFRYKRMKAKKDTAMKYVNFENEDSNCYDVFISYSPSDKLSLQLVSKELVPFLEELNLTMCTDKTGYLSQAVTVRDTHEARSASKKTVIILSPSYIEEILPELESESHSLSTAATTSDNTIAVSMVQRQHLTRYMNMTETNVLNKVRLLEWPTEENGTGERELFWQDMKEHLCINIYEP